MGGLRRRRRLLIAVVVAVTLGLLETEPVVANPSAPSTPVQAVPESLEDGEPAGRLLPHEVSEVEPAIPAAAPDGGAEGAMQKSCDAKPVKYLGDLTIRRGLLGTISGRD